MGRAVTKVGSLTGAVALRGMLILLGLVCTIAPLDTGDVLVSVIFLVEGRARSSITCSATGSTAGNVAGAWGACPAARNNKICSNADTARA